MTARFAFATAALVLSIPLSAGAQPKATDYPAPKPAFPGQTHAPAAKSASLFKVEVLVEGPLNLPWSLAFLPDGKMLVTELFGTMRTVRKDGVLSAPVAGVPGVKVISGQGLHDIALDPNFPPGHLFFQT